ncbi:MAG: class I SAM-dependent methyltransferase [Polyangiaceae bacterium]|nr:class I SAM-dependent methyltransferase [Polyangiaceae bacterium]
MPATGREGVLLEALRAHVLGASLEWLPERLRAREEPRSAAPEALAAHVLRHRELIGGWLVGAVEREPRSGAWHEDPAHHLALAVLRRAQAMNQYFSFSRERVRALDRLLSRSLGELVTTIDEAGSDPGALSSRLTRHWRALERALDGWLDDVLGDQPPGLALATDGSIVCGDYDPELQRRLLGLAAGELVEPVLDLGCGEHAALVRALRAEGIAIAGVDRVAAPLDGVTEGDWLEVPLAAAQWGTIISHLGFSLHFLHHHLRAEGSESERYAVRYMQLLSALRPGGAFIYAPGLPFFEELLPPARYRVDKRAIAAASPGESSYACRVERLG